MLLTIAVVVAAAIAAILIYAATKPDSFRVERTAHIKAPPRAIFPHISDLRSHGAWSPFDRDPATKRHFKGAPSGKGQVYEWDGDRKTGAGRIEITDADAPSKVTMKLDMIRPFSANNIVEFTLAPQGEATDPGTDATTDMTTDATTDVTTDVTWAMHGRQPYMAKVVGCFMNCDKMVGSQFERGLADLKTIAER